ncbi:YicC/YloC family endoribonuclease [Halalkalibacter alkalisediminis]|uniref:YicC/YloC family endoribonuclease n=1 Tax=Halalkalibacter alkalisediminis TaxID=935616 RepID=A0ABV6NDV9_9BACI|nr:YicC/YloC family endoribonuclease [Halalkalibacter alkalisediminis]
MRSMTGYGTTVVKGDFGELSIEVKAVNHRFLDMQIKLPQSLQTLEDQLRKRIKGQVYRGKLDISIHLEEEIEKKRVLRLDEDLLNQYVSAFKIIEKKLGQEANLDVTALLMDKMITSVEEMNSNVDIDQQTIMRGLDQALESFNDMRQNEGRFLQQDMEKWLAYLEKSCKEVEILAPELLNRYREKVELRIRSFLNEEIDVDETRLLSEIAIFAEKIDVSEELVRLKAHVHQFQLYLEKEEAVGRRLDFLIQEMNREVNTIGSKGADTSIRQHVVEMKGLLEKLKEQVQNVE